MKRGGFTLIELLIVLLINGFLVTALITFFLRERYHSHHQASKIALENNLYFAKFFLIQAIRNAGYAGCNRINYLKIRQKPPDTVVQSLQGYAAQGNHWIPPLPAFLSRNPAPTNDVIRVVNASQEVKYFKRNSKITLPAASVFPHYWIFSDCEKANILKGAKTEKVIDFGKTLSENIGRSTWRDISFYIGRTSRKDECGKFIYALYQKSLNGHAQEIVEGIDGLHIAYGQNMDFNFTSANLIQAWNQVNQVKITLHGVKNKYSGELTKELTFFINLRNASN